MIIGESHLVSKGDRIDFHYSVSGWGKRGQVESLIYKLDMDARWKVREYDFNEDTGKLRIRVEILQNPFPLMVVIVVIGIIGGGLFCWMSLDKVEKITASPVGGAVALGAIAAAIMALKTYAKKG